ncbi:MAG: hypothetical protein GQ557_02180 [Mycoplasmataceae bacterium]|nr:hypothetical protein [Mycoplasmataceae bacterium]
MIANNIVKKFLSNIWLFENVLWKYSNLVAINQKKEKIKKILFEVYGYKDIYDVVPQELDNEWVDKFLRTLFTYHENPRALELEKPK